MDAYDRKHRLRYVSLPAATLLVNLCRGCDLCDVGNIMRVVQHNATAQLGPLNNL